MLKMSKPTIRTRLLLSVNGPLAVLVAMFLVYDYSKEFAQRMQDKHIALEEEAKAVLPGVRQVWHHGAEEVQKYIDTVCAQMQDAESPGHHIAVEIGPNSFQAESHHRNSSDILQRMRQAAQSPDHLADWGEAELLVGHQERDGVAVYVSESLEQIRTTVWDDVLRRLLGVFALALVAALIVNFVVLRVVTRPLNQLVRTVQDIGKGQLGVQTHSLHSAELDYLAMEINLMSRSLAEANQQRQSQMDKAAKIQQNLLPKSVETLGLNMAFLFEPADEVGGDFFDVLQLGERTFLVCVADVTGHGVPAAMAAAMLKTLLLQAVEYCASPAEMMKFINQRFITVSLMGDFNTMVLARIDTRTHRLEYASGGHEPAWILSPTGNMHELPSTGTIVGIDEAANWDEVEMDLAIGDRILICTDGISETMNPSADLFGRDRLTHALVETQDVDVDQATESIRDSLRTYRNGAPQHDDVTLVLIEISE